MTLEIERKWLIDSAILPFSLSQAPRHRIVQSYVSFLPQIRLRSLDDERFILTIKGNAPGQTSALVREECEFELTAEAYERLRAKTEGKTPIKTRYFVNEAATCESLVPPDQTTYADGVALTASSQFTNSEVLPSARVFEIDVYEDDFEGLAVAEMEFASLDEAEAFPTPSWALKDISEDASYRNVVMAQSEN